MAQTIQQRARLIRSATPDILESLYEMQNRICDLCGHPIQDLMLAALDHSVPVIFFAKSDLPINDAIAQANDPQNLRSAHAVCNNTKRHRTREEWFALGLDKAVSQPRFYTEGELLELQFRLGAGGRVGSGGVKTYAKRVGAFASGMAAKGGRITREQHLGIFGLTNEQLRIAGGLGGSKSGGSEAGKARMTALGHSGAGGRVVGPVTGRKHKEYKTGVCGRSPEKMRADGIIGGRISGHRNKENRIGIFAPENYGLGGRKNVESGHIQALGVMQGRKNAENGVLAKARHIHWHVRRGIVNPKCKLCYAA